MASHIESEIKLLSDERVKIYNKYQDSYDEDKGDYTDEFPEIVDTYGDKILSTIIKYQDNLKLEFILEELTKLGQAPNILYDDNGHFAVTGNGWQSISSNLDKEDERDNMQLGFEVEKERWHSTVREALKDYLTE